VAAAAAWAIALYLFVALSRIAHPFELEWQEGGCVDHVARIAAGEPLYVAPNLDFIPFIYPPGFFYVAAGVSALTGPGFFPLRLVSFLASIGCLLLIFEIVRRESGAARHGLVAAGLFAACFEIGGAWLDLARIDSLFLCLVLAGIAALRIGVGFRAAIAAGFAFAAAALVKQTALFIAIWLAGWLLVSRRRQLLPFLVPIAVVIAGFTVVADAMSDGWYSYYVFDLPRQHPFAAIMIPLFWVNDLIRPVPLALAGSLGLVWWSRRSRDDLAFHAALFIAMVGAAWASRSHLGGHNNVVLPAYAALAIQAALFVARAERSTDALVSSGAVDVRGQLLGAVVPAAVVAQLLFLVYAPSTHIPREGDRAAGKRLVASLSGIEGEVLVLDHGHIPRLAGKATHAHRMGFNDVLRGEDEALRLELEGQLRDALLSQRFAAVVIDRPWRDFFMAALEESYEPAGPIFADPRVFWTVSGLRSRPASVYRPKPAGVPPR
jgi:hypothetical protein